MNNYKIAVIAGDGIGVEVIDEGIRVINAARDAFGFTIEFEKLPWSCTYYQEHKEMMPANGLEILRGFDAIYLGAIGWPTVPDHISLWELLLPIRQTFQQYANVRPVRLFPGLTGPLRDRTSDDINFVCVRENTEGEYAGVGGRVHQGTPHEVAIQTDVFTRVGVERVMRFSFELAMKRKKKLTAATKSNASRYAMVFWDEVFEQLGKEYPEVKTEKWHVDALAARFVTRPETFDVVVASNLFGDLLTDLGGAIQGSLGTAASANLSPDKIGPSMFEPVHGSAPDIVGKGIANPIGAIWAGAMMLEHLGQAPAADAIVKSIERLTAEGTTLTRDLGGKASTQEVGKVLASHVLEAVEESPALS
jgi:tartrate dehydrogenase/decarboxylase / D-malate dehydrogenase